MRPQPGSVNSGRKCQSKVENALVISPGICLPPQMIQHRGRRESIRREPGRRLEVTDCSPRLWPEAAGDFADVEATVCQPLLQFAALGERQHPLMAGPG